MRPHRGDVVKVTWVDAEELTLGWKPAPEYRSLGSARTKAYRTSGYWVGGTKGRAVIAQSLSLVNRRITNVISIPASAVVKVIVLRKASRRVARIFR